MSRIVGLNDLKKKNESKEDKKQEQLYVGGINDRGFVSYIKFYYLSFYNE